MALVHRTTFTIIVICLLMAATRRVKIYNGGFVGKDPYEYSIFLTIVFAGVLIFVEGFRHGYMDTGNYKGIYQYLSDDLGDVLSSSQPGFDFLQWLLRKISTKPQFFLLVVAAFINIADLIFIKRNTNDFPFSIFLYFVLSFIGNMNGIRQITAATFLMLAFPWVEEKKYFRYIVWVVILSTIHRSILVVIPLLFIFGGKRWNIGVVGFVLFCVFSAVVPGPINAIIGNLVSYDYSHYLTAYTRGANIFNVFVEAVPLVLGLLYHRSNIDRIGENRTIDVLINMQAIRFGFVVLATGMAQYARIGMYMKNVTAIIIPFLINNVFIGSGKKYIKVTAIILYLLMFIVENAMLNAKGAFDVLYLDFSIFN